MWCAQGAQASWPDGCRGKVQTQRRCGNAKTQAAGHRGLRHCGAPKQRMVGHHLRLHTRICTPSKGLQKELESANFHELILHIVAVVNEALKSRHYLRQPEVCQGLFQSPPTRSARLTGEVAQAWHRHVANTRHGRLFGHRDTAATAASYMEQNFRVGASVGHGVECLQSAKRGNTELVFLVVQGDDGNGVGHRRQYRLRAPAQQASEGAMLLHRWRTSGRRATSMSDTRRGNVPVGAGSFRRPPTCWNQTVGQALSPAVDPQG